ncbi:hypothetical protein CKY04_10415 [Photorhabdus sp. S8-52]|nr:hypothetical protein CKY05_10330 [Photorhabdus sp. S10-54]RAW99334.1 hypothetical protein CKY03_09855 [Photorhabdus sp. S9-53]RAX03539.1 hypothetical protein CKY04_10415 [Photorhabdus sp. S8-52]
MIVSSCRASVLNHYLLFSWKYRGEGLSNFVFSKNHLNPFQSQLEELDSKLVPIEGDVPSKLKGTFFRIGPGRLHRGNEYYNHPFDGDGMIFKVTFSDNGVFYRNRHVLTKEYLREEEAQRLLYRSVGTVPKKLKLRMRFFIIKNPANTNIVYHSHKLLALWEGGMPHLINPVTLETISKYDFSGKLRARFSFLPKLNLREVPFTAHPKKIPDNDNLYGFGVTYGIGSKLTLYKIDNTGDMTVICNIPLKKRYLIHDFIVTKNYFLFFLGGPHINLKLRNVIGNESILASMNSRENEDGRVLLVSRECHDAKFYDAAPGFIFHFTNGYEDADGNVIFDASFWRSFPVFTQNIFKNNSSELCRFTLCTASGNVDKEILFRGNTDFPAINPTVCGRKHRYAWFVCWGDSESEEKSITKFDFFDKSVISHSFDNDLPEEPVFVAKKGSVKEDDGWLIFKVYVEKLHCTDVVVLNADDLSMVCRLRLPHHIPMGMHHCWINEVMLEA